MSVALVGAREGSLVELLESELSPLIAQGSAVSIEVWERALVGLAREFLSRPGKQFRARLVEHAYAIAGGAEGSLSPRVPQLVELLHAGSLIVDDIQDDSAMRRGAPSLHLVCGMPLALNTGNWLYFAAFEVAARMGLDDSSMLAVYRALSRCLFRCHQGQALDLAIDVAKVRQRDMTSLADSSATLKTGALVAFAAELGAIAAGASDRDRLTLATFGSELGTALQRLDDLGSILSPDRRAKGLEDLAGGRLTWVWGHLAGELDELHFAGLQMRLRRARDERGGARRSSLTAVLRELASLIDDSAKESVGQALRTALGSLGETFDGAALDPLRAEILRLESSYV